MHSNVKLQVAAIFCVCNLVWRDEPGSTQRQARLRELGIYRILQQLRHTKDTQLLEKYEYILYPIHILLSLIINCCLTNFIVISLSESRLP